MKKRLVSLFLLLLLLPGLSFAENHVRHTAEARHKADGMVLGVDLGGLMLQEPLVVAPGGSVIAGYEIPKTLMYAKMGGYGFDSDSEGSVLKLDLGVRRFLSESDLAFFFGGGLGLTNYNMRVNTGDRDTNGLFIRYNVEQLAIEPFVEGGVELFRTRKIRTTLGARVGVPIANIGFNIPVAMNMSFSYAF